MRSLFTKLPALSLAAAALLGMGSTSALAQGKTITLCWAAWDPANALVELSKDFTAQTKRQHEVRVRAVAELRRSHAQRAQQQGQAVRPDHRRQPVDRRLGRKRPLREAERLLRQGRHQDQRLRTCHGARLRRVAEGHAELLGAAGDGRRAGLDLPQGLVRQARAARGVQEEVRPRARGAEDLDRLQAGGRVLLGPHDRRQEGVRHLPVHRARLRRHHDGREQRAVPDGLQVPGPEEAVFDGRLRQRPRCDQGPRVLQVAVQVLHAAGADQLVHGRGPRRIQVGPGGDDDELVRLLPGPVQGPERRRRQDRLLRQPERQGQGLAARRPGHLGGGVFAEPQRGAGLHQVVRHARRAEEVVGAGRLLVPQGRAERRGLQEERAVRRGVPRQRWTRWSTSGPTRATRSCCSPSRSASTTSWLPTRAPPRRRSTAWSPTGRRCSRKTER